MNAKPADIDEYLAALPEETRRTLAAMRRSIKALAPEAVESISYGMPAFKYRGRRLAYIGAAKKHCALYGVSVDKYRDDLAAYETSSRGTVRFPIGEPLPDALIETLLGGRMADIEAETAARNSTRRKTSS